MEKESVDYLQVKMIEENWAKIQENWAYLIIPWEIKRGAFEITITDEDGKSALVWSGLKLGPPRRLKFPDADKLIEDVKKNLV